jgi:hypothetical protein
LTGAHSAQRVSTIHNATASGILAWRASRPQSQTQDVATLGQASIGTEH